MFGFFVVELLLHAISEINAVGPGSPFAQRSGDRSEVRQIERVIITSPLAIPAQERKVLIDRVHGAIDLLWRTQHWDQSGLLAHPARPQLSLGIGPDVGLQLVYVFHEVTTKFGGSFSDLVECVRRRSGEPDARDSLRISSIELGRRTAGLTVVDYDVAHDGTVQATLVATDRTPVGGERVVTDFGNFGFEVGQPAHRALDRIDLAIALAHSQPALAAGRLSGAVARRVASVVHHDI